LWDWQQWQVWPRAAERVINYFPWYPKDPILLTYMDYCQVKLMLYYPFIALIDLLSFDGQIFPDYIHAF
jgi:hypothetical protein